MVNFRFPVINSVKWGKYPIFGVFFHPLFLAFFPVLTEPHILIAYSYHFWHSWKSKTRTPKIAQLLIKSSFLKKSGFFNGGTVVKSPKRGHFWGHFLTPIFDPKMTPFLAHFLTHFWPQKWAILHVRKANWGSKNGPHFWTPTGQKVGTRFGLFFGFFVFFRYFWHFRVFWPRRVKKHHYWRLAFQKGVKMGKMAKMAILTPQCIRMTPKFTQCPDFTMLGFQ